MSVLFTSHASSDKFQYGTSTSITATGRPMSPVIAQNVIVLLGVILPDHHMGKQL